MFSKICCWNKFHLRNTLLKQTSIWWKSRNPFQKNKHIFFNRSWRIVLLSISVSLWRGDIPDHTMLAVCFLNQHKLALKPLDLLKTFTQYWWTTSCQPIVDMVTSWCFFETYSSKWVGSASQSFWGESSNVWNHPLQVATPLPLPKTNKSALKSYQDPKGQDLVSLCHHFFTGFAV